METMTPEVLLHLQELLLQAVLLSQPLPGQSKPVRMPDLSFVMRHEVIYVAQENLAGPVKLKNPPKPLRILSIDALRALARQQGDIVYLHFQPAVATDGEVRLTLEGSIAAQDSSKQSMGLSSVHVRFVKVANTWKAVDDPVYSAA